MAQPVDSSTSPWRGRRVRIESRLRSARRARRGAADRVPARRPRLAGDVAATSRSALCDAAGVRGLVYSRPGYGRSTPRAARRALGPRLHAPPGARGAAGAARRAAASTRRSRPGCSATATAARSRCCTRRASRSAWPALVVLAPHIVVEDVSVASIAAGARRLPARPTCAQRLARYHDDADSAFWGWNDIWLHPPFRDWTIEAEIAAHPLPAARGAGRRRRVRHARADPRHRARACRRRVLLELPRLRPFAAPRPARGA